MLKNELNFDRPKSVGASLLSRTPPLDALEYLTVIGEIVYLVLNLKWHTYHISIYDPTANMECQF